MTTTHITPSDFVIEQMRSVLPEGVPLSFTITDAVWRKKSTHEQIAWAELSMFDGLPAVIEVRNNRLMHSHRWLAMVGGHCSYEDGEWRRVPVEI